jgi:hypothetical protein
VDRVIDDDDMIPDLPEPQQQARQWLRAEVRRVAVLIRHLEQETPGCFGEAAAVIRRQAAGDDVAFDDLTAALTSVRLTLGKVVAFQERNTAPVGRTPAEDDLTAWSADRALGRVWRTWIYRRRRRFWRRWIG